MSAFDREILAEIYDIDPATYTEVIDSFVGKWPSTIGELDALLQDGGSDQVMRCAHKLKGGSRTIGLVEVGNVSQRIELAARAGDLETCRKAMPDLVSSGERAITFLEAIRSCRPPDA
jgi:HPt (histidine-containing phosphotransfer) domain-containing protein